jgi:antitoxin Phd
MKMSPLAVVVTVLSWQVNDFGPCCESDVTKHKKQCNGDGRIYNGNCPVFFRQLLVMNCLAVYGLSRLSIIEDAVMEKRWQLQEAKNKFSQVAEEAAVYGPQIVTKHGRDAVVILGVDEYRQLTERRGALLDFFRDSPLVGSGLDITRESDEGREVDL